MKILFIQTGGTIDKDYPKTSNGYAFEFGQPATIRILERLNPSFEYEILTAFQKDSLEITDGDRRKLMELIRNHPCQQVIITHGTDTLFDTAKFLSPLIEKTIVLTGAFRPERFSNSDADINLGCAIATVSVAAKGVYVAMNGIVKTFDKMKRDSQTGKFY